MKARIYDATLSALEQSEKCRNNMTALYAWVLIDLGYPTDLIDLATCKKVPALETVARARRLIVAERPELKGCKEVEEARTEETGKYITTAVYGLLEG